MDYPFDAALASALGVCDEAVVVAHADNADDTLAWLWELQMRHPGRVKVRLERWQFDRSWQERVWDWGAEMTSAEWLMYHDADEAIREEEAAILRGLMADPEVKLISLPYVHLYATPCYREVRDFYRRNTRLGRRSYGYRMRNWCSDEHPTRAACQVVYGPEERNANDLQAPGLHLADVPMYHYGWCRSAKALAISQCKHHAWYADGAGLEDGRVPQVGPFDFRLGEMVAEGRVMPYGGPHPASMAPWFEARAAEWAATEQEVRP